MSPGGGGLTGFQVDQRAAREPYPEPLELGREDPLDRGLVVGRERLRRVAVAGTGRAADHGGACQRAGGSNPEQSPCARGEPQFTISTGVPSGSTFESFVI